jgi:hypothetical protein
MTRIPVQYDFLLQSRCNQELYKFFQCAEETGYSRLLGGIHTSQDNETGLTKEKKLEETSISFCGKSRMYAKAKQTAQLTDVEPRWNIQ